MTTSSQPTEGTLDDCPFCSGHKPKLDIVRDGYRVHCTSCGSAGAPEFHGPSSMASSRERAISAWNRRALSAQEEPGEAMSFQSRVQPWMMACFGAEISGDKVERGDRLLEEVLELLQSGGYDPARVDALRDYVWSRPTGEPSQEVGGVQVTLATYCLAHDLDMHQAGETELARIWTKVDQIRAKQAAKPVGSALPVATLTSPVRGVETLAVKGLERDGNHAKSVAGSYSIVKHLNHYGMVGPDDSFDDFGYRFKGSLEKCREAAQADYETRIRSALAPSNPEAPAVPAKRYCQCSNSKTNPCNVCGAPKFINPEWLKRKIEEDGDEGEIGAGFEIFPLPEAPASREVAWLIERKDASLFQQPHWYYEQPDGWHSWRPNAHEAKRFATKAEADAYPAYQMIASDPTISTTEHVFIGSLPEAPAAPVGEFLERINDLITSTYEKDGDGYYDTPVTILLRDIRSALVATPPAPCCTNAAKG
ncbi:Lar family restriction alleviation protein [Mesorhizobium sp. M0189]|uniref:Lar family restriction alleviation protein n=1 Tax=Mesorhizobium sp. M0189 TaxID=2956909 RepID=UPI00333AEB03